METELVDLSDLKNSAEEEDSEEIVPLLQSKSSLTLLPNEEKILKSTLLDDILSAFSDTIFIAPIAAIIFALLGIYIALDPFNPTPKRQTPISLDELVISP
jgi:hypothetical protein